MYDDSDEEQPTKFLRLRPRRDSARHESKSWPAPRPPITDPREIVQANVHHDRQAGLYNVKPVRRRFRRRWAEFLLLCGAGNGLAVWFLHWIEANTPTLLVTGSAMIFYTLALSWVMFVLHDDY